MRDALAVDSLRDPKTTEMISEVLPIAAEPIVQEGVRQEFEEILASALEMEAVSAAPVSHEREKLASSVSASIVMPQSTAQFNSFLRDFTGIYNLEEILPQGAIGKLRDAVAEGIITAEKAIEKLKNAAEDFHQKLAAGTSVSLFLADKGIHLQVEKQSEEEMLAQLREDASRLRETALKNIIPESSISGQSADVWVQQVWPLNQANSIFNKYSDQDVPYNPERGKSEISFADREVQEWDENFEAEWSNAHTVQVTSNSSQKSEQPVSERSFGEAEASVNPAVSSVPSGDRLFREMVSLIQTNLDQGNQRMHMELHPENLGQIKLKLSLQGDKFSARFLVEDGSVRDLMMERMDELKAALSAQGIEAADIHIALKKDSSVVEDILSNSSGRRDFRQTGFSGVMTADYFHSTSEDGYSAWVV